MLNKKDLIKDVEEKYIPMLKMVNIPDFTKCIAQFSGLHIENVNDEVIKHYLLTWAKNKHRFFEMLGNKLKMDTPISYKDENIDVVSSLRDLEKDYPAFALWLEEFRDISSNKIRERDLHWQIRDTITRLFPDCRIEGCLATHFFKSYINAPDELVTKIGRIWENEEIQGTYTISIDPVDMMLASENPYNWESCYRLEGDNESSHADGCLAAILDDTSLITYIWNNEGKFSLYNKYSFKNIRYYRMREWIAISEDNQAIHFNDIYPGKTYSEEFYKKLRVIVEDFVNKNVTWVKNNTYRIDVNRAYLYGYGEFRYNYIYITKELDDELLVNKTRSNYIWEVYNTQIECPCGCGGYLPGNDWSEDDYEGYHYNGSGFLEENFYPNEPDNEEWCDYLDDYCDRSCNDCDNCPYYNRCNAVCELDNNVNCEYCDEAEGDCLFDPDESNIVHCGGHCEQCKFYKEHQKKKENKDNNEEGILSTTTTIHCGEAKLVCNINPIDTITIYNAGISIAPKTISALKANITGKQLQLQYEWPHYPDEEINPPMDI